MFENKIRLYVNDISIKKRNVGKNYYVLNLKGKKYIISYSGKKSLNYVSLRR